MALPVRFAPSATRFLRQQSPQVASSLISEVVYLGQSPELEPDDARKAPFYTPPVFMRIYRTLFHWIIYDVDSNRILIANLGNADEKPHLYRREEGSPE